MALNSYTQQYVEDVSRRISIQVSEFETWTEFVFSIGTKEVARFRVGKSLPGHCCLPEEHWWCGDADRNPCTKSAAFLALERRVFPGASYATPEWAWMHKDELSGWSTTRGYDHWGKRFLQR